MAWNNEEWFMINRFKIKMCKVKRKHPWSECPYAHRGERSRRRDHNLHYYISRQCRPFMMHGVCPEGQDCRFAHGMFESMFHPQRYRSRPCRFRRDCNRRFCAFSHDPPPPLLQNDDDRHLPTFLSLGSSSSSSRRRTYY